MTHHTGAVPDTLLRPGQWSKRAACIADPEMMFPDNNEHGIADAKAVCAGCPVVLDCLIDALRTGDNDHGIRGGLKPNERRAVNNIVEGRYGDHALVEEAVMRVLHPVTSTRTLRDAWEDHITPMPGGHLAWTGSTTFSWRGHSYAPKRTSFFLHRGREPEGIVRRTCDVVECVQPMHLEDNAERKQRVAAQPRRKAA